MKKPIRLVILVMLIALVAAACGASGSSATTAPEQTTTAPEQTTTAPEQTTTAPEQTTTVPEKEVKKVAFFGFSAANGFAQATWAGIQKGAAKLGVEVKFFDPNFDANTQVSQIQDAITSGEYQAFIVQANDGNAVVPVIEEAIAAGITVVGEFTPIGPKLDTIEPQVDGLYFVGWSILDNANALGELGIMACKDKDPCKVAYLEGFRSLPLDSARTEWVKAKLATASNIDLVASVEGGYTQDSGLAAAQDVLTAHPDVDVMIGSSQAILGAEQAVKDAGRAGEVALIGNGAPRQAVAAVKAGRWFAVTAEAEEQAGEKAIDVAVRAARGEDVPRAFDTATILPTPLGTKDNLPADFNGEWDA